jgi:hypothetical protein
MLFMKFNLGLGALIRTSKLISRYSSSSSSGSLITPNKKIKLFDQEYDVDEWTNITPNIAEKLDRNLLHTKSHPLYHLTNKIKHFFYTNFVNKTGTPYFSVYDRFRPIVTVDQNFDR